MLCAVYGCKSRANKSSCKDIKFFRFPRDVKFREIWRVACRRKDNFNVENARICSLHFRGSDLARNLRAEIMNHCPGNHRPLKPDAVPSVLLPNEEASRASQADSEQRDDRIKKREQKRIIEEVFKSLDDRLSSAECDTKENSEVSNVQVATTKSVGVNTDPDGKDQTISALRQRVAVLEQRERHFNRLFTPRQIKKLVGTQSRIYWTEEDISDALVLYLAGRQAYKLFVEKGCPLPPVSTLKLRLRLTKARCKNETSS